MFSNRKRDWRFLGFMWVDPGGRRDCSDGKQRDSLSLGGLFCKFYLSSFVSSLSKETEDVFESDQNKSKAR